MKTLIKVQKRHINGGERNNPWTCPIACAVKELVGAEYASMVSVSSQAIQFGAGVNGIELPQNAQAFIENFDEQQPVKPFRFTLDVPAAILK